MSDKELFKGLKNNDKKALEYLYRVHYCRLCNYVNTMVSLEYVAEDIVNESYMDLWESRYNLKTWHVISYLYMIVRNKCIDYNRGESRSYRKSIISIDNITNEFLNDSSHFSFNLEIPDSSTNPLEVILSHELEATINSLIEQLPVKCRKVISLRKDGYKNKEIAGELGITVKSVEKHLSKALSYIKKGIEMVLVLFF